MASHATTILALVSLLLALSTHAATPAAPAPAADAPAAAADAPAADLPKKPAPVTFTSVLKNSTQFTTLLRLLKETQVGVQLDNQIKDSYAGMTLLAPTDNAFSSLKAGTLNGLTPQDQTELILYHVLTKYFSTSVFQTASNPIDTQGSGEDGTYTVNVTATGSGDQFNVSTGINTTPLGSAVYSKFPIAVYQIDSVLLPPGLFGPKPKHKKALSPTASVDGKTAPSTPAGSAEQTASGAGDVGVTWRRSAFAAGLAGVAMLIWW